MKKFMKHWLPSLMVTIILSLVVRTYVVEAMVVPTGSMLPTIKLEDRIVVEKVMPLTELHHGDIVVFYPPIKIEGADKLVKRLIGLPGDTIEIRDGSLYRNNVKINEPYIKEPMQYTYGPVRVPENEYFFLGDNRNDSYDSHAWETDFGIPAPFVNKKNVIGKVIFNIPTHYIFQ